MSAVTVNNYGTIELTKSNMRLIDNKESKSWCRKTKSLLKQIKYLLRETTVEPCLFFYMLCTALSSFAVQNMHLEKSCRINMRFSDEICDRIRDRNTTGLELELNQVQSLVAKVVAWKFPLQTGIPAVLVLFIGAWSDKTKKRKICILVPFIGEIIANIGLLFATFYELSLTVTALIEALPPAFTGSYIISFMGVYSFIADRTSMENRTFRVGLVTICVTLGMPTGIALSGILLQVIGYYGMFSMLILIYLVSFIYGVLRLEDILPPEDNTTRIDGENGSFKRVVKEVFGLVASTVLVALKPRAFGMRKQLLSVIAIYVIFVGPMYGDCQVSYLYAIRKFSFHEIEYTVYGTINIVLGICGTFFCITFLSKRMHMQDSLIGLLAGVSKIVGCVVLAFAPNKAWYYSATIFSIFSSSGLTAVRSIATKSVPIEEVAKFSSVIGVMEAIAPSMYMLTSSFIYVNTIDTFPGAFYVVDAVVAIVALILFSYIYVLERKRERYVVTEPSRNEEFEETKCLGSSK